MSKTLIIMRHAEALTTASSDFARPLSEHGKVQAKETNAWLIRQGISIDLGLVSSARRTQMTADGITMNACELRDDLYDASARDIASAVTQVSDDVDSLLVIAHNPGVSDFVHQAGAMVNLRPAECVVLSFDGEWAALDFRLLDVIRAYQRS